MNGSSLAVLGADHIGLTVPDIDAAVAFYTDAFDARELFRMGPFDAADLPRSTDGRDWTDTHVNVPDARLRFAVLELAPGLRLELFAYERPVDARTEAPRRPVPARCAALKVMPQGDCGCRPRRGVSV